MTGPILILDKSTFQGLSLDEHTQVAFRFMTNTTPTLVSELVADLEKPPRKGNSSDEEVRILAEKFCGSGGVVNMDYRSLCLGSLSGQRVPCEGRIIAANFSVHDDAVGGPAALVDLSSANHAILRLAARQPTNDDREFAMRWREMTRDLSLASLRLFLAARGIELHPVATVSDALDHANQLLSDPRYLRIWVSWLLPELGADDRFSRQVQTRAVESAGTLPTFAPYAAHCMRAILLLAIASRSGLVGDRRTNLVDLQYLFYTPFCQVFVSDDKVHRILAPALLGDEQDFVLGKDLKRWMKQIDDFMEGLTDDDRRLLDGILSLRPPPLCGNGAWDLWDKHCGPWSPDQGNLALELGSVERSKGQAMVQRMLGERSTEA